MKPYMSKVVDMSQVVEKWLKQIPVELVYIWFLTVLDDVGTIEIY